MWRTFGATQIIRNAPYSRSKAHHLELGSAQFLVYLLFLLSFDPQSPFLKKRLCSLKNFQWKKFSKLDVFFKYVLDHSESIPSKKFLSKIFRFLSLFVSFGQKIDYFDLGGGEILKKFSPILKGLYCGHFVLLHASLRLLTSAGSLDLLNL